MEKSRGFYYKGIIYALRPIKSYDGSIKYSLTGDLFNSDGITKDYLKYFDGHIDYEIVSHSICICSPIFIRIK